MAGAIFTSQRGTQLCLPAQPVGTGANGTTPGVFNDSSPTANLVSVTLSRQGILSRSASPSSPEGISHPRLSHILPGLAAHRCFETAAKLGTYMHPQPNALSEGHRPRNVDWKRAAALLYGDWGTSKAYVIGLAFAAAQFAALPLILAVCAVTGLVAFNYARLCHHFPDGGGVYSAARVHGRLLAVIGALLLIADLTVTAALSGWAGLSYLTASGGAIPAIGFLKDHITGATICVLLFMGWLNWHGPRHSGNLAAALTVPVLLAVATLAVLSLPHLTLRFLERPHDSPAHLWGQFVAIILALSGVEAIANLTGVMKEDPGSPAHAPSVRQTASRAIWPVAVEVIVGMALLGWAMLSLPAILPAGQDAAATLQSRSEDMLRFMAEQYGAATLGPTFGHVFGWAVGIVFCLLLFSAANTAIVAMTGLLYMMARDREMPPAFTRLNRHGVPVWPLLIVTGLPIIVLLTTHNFTALAGLYAIGVVGAIAVNLGSCAFNRQAGFSRMERALFFGTFLLLAAVELTLAHEKHDALFFVVCILGAGLGVRAWTLKRAGLANITLPRELAALLSSENAPAALPTTGQRLLVCVRGITPVLHFALEEAALRKAALCVLYVRELAIYPPHHPGTEHWQEDPQAAATMAHALRAGAESGVSVVPLYAVSDDPAATILDVAATLGADTLLLGASHRAGLARLLKGDVITRVATGLPEEIPLVIRG